MKTKVAFSVLLTAALLLPSCSWHSPAGDARMGARHAVLASLKNPGGSKYRSGAVCARTAAEDYWVVYSEVDAQNDFGAMIRVRYLLLMYVPEEGEAECLHSIQVEGDPKLYEVLRVIEECDMGENWVTFADEDWEKKK